jgi:hypothetical protein
MTETQIRRRLQNALHKRITWAEWQHLKEIDLVGEHLRESLDWPEFLDLAAAEIDRLRRFYENKLREESGDISTEQEIEQSLVADSHGMPDAPSLSNRTLARSTALGTLNRLRTGGSSPGGIAMYGTLLPRGGLDGTIAQWVYLVGVELWVPPEEFIRSYRSIQRTMLAEPNPPKTSERVFDVARFVWEHEMVHGMRLSWPVLWMRWNNSPFGQEAGTFKNWRDFRTYFLRGERATPPRYKATNEQITELVRSRSHQKAFDEWASKVRE